MRNHARMLACYTHKHACANALAHTNRHNYTQTHTHARAFVCDCVRRGYVEVEDTGASFGEVLVLVCEAPAGEGADQPIVVSASGHSSQPRGLNYKMPEVDWDGLTLMKSDTIGGDVYELSGINFGTQVYDT